MAASPIPRRSAIKCEKDEKAERLKVKKAIEKGNLDGAKIYAQVGAAWRNPVSSIWPARVRAAAQPAPRAPDGPPRERPGQRLFAPSLNRRT